MPFKSLFPIGELTKPEVREIAAKADLITAEKKDSQGLCFIGKVKLPDFLQQQLQPKEGVIVEVSKDIESYKKAIFGESIQYDLKGSTYNRVGETTAPLVGGNLTMLHTMLGSKSSIDTSGKILFIEEIGEYKYHIDRMLQSLKRAGYFDNCAGVLVGDISKMRKNTTLWGSSVEQLIIDALSEYNFPICFNMPAGHEKDNRAMILGRTVKMTVSEDKSTVVFE